MMKPKDLSKYLSLVLRHDPAAGHITLDQGGWADLKSVVEGAPLGVTLEAIEQVVQENDKQRFSIREGRIRANQGHTVPVELDLLPTAPPEILYHGTYPEAVDPILEKGILKMARHHVHMSEDSGTAVTVGRRSGTPIVFRIQAGEMHRNGFVFYRSVNGVWLVDHVPPAYLTQQKLFASRVFDDC